MKASFRKEGGFFCVPTWGKKSLFSVASPNVLNITPKMKGETTENGEQGRTRGGYTMWYRDGLRGQVPTEHLKVPPMAVFESLSDRPLMGAVLYTISDLIYNFPTEFHDKIEGHWSSHLTMKRMNCCLL